VLAAEPGLKGRAIQAVGRIRNLLTDGKGRFIGRIKRYFPLSEEGEQLPDEEHQMATTVTRALKEFQEDYGAWIDAALTKEMSNTQAITEFFLDPDIPGPMLSATALLNLEGKLTQFRDVLTLIPTLDPAVRWERVGDSDVHVSPSSTTFKMQKTPDHHELAAPTKEHPAQVKFFWKETPIGRFETTLRSGLLSEQEKRAMVARIDSLTIAVKQARQRANQVDIVEVKLADALFGYILTGELFWE
jgi:hypothetical protein